MLIFEQCKIYTSISGICFQRDILLQLAGLPSISHGKAPLLFAKRERRQGCTAGKGPQQQLEAVTKRLGLSVCRGDPCYIIFTIDTASKAD
jgi:hypothetical protein